MKRFITVFLELLLLLVFIVTIVFFAWVAYINLQIDNKEVWLIPEPTGEVLTVNGYSIHVQTFGDINAPIPIVLIHDFDAAGGSVFTELANQLIQDHFVIVPDLLGFGSSQRVIEAGEHYSTAGQAAMLLAVLDQLGVAQVDLVGHGYGGEIAAQIALDYPSRVRRLVFISASIYPQDFDLITQMSGLPLGIGRAFTYTFQGGGSVDYSYGDPNCLNCQFSPRNAFVLVGDTTDAIFAMHQSPDASDVAENIGSLSMPVAVIWGANDTVLPLEYGERLIAESNASEQFIILNGRHHPYKDNLSEVSAILLDFLGN